MDYINEKLLKSIYFTDLKNKELPSVYLNENSNILIINISKKHLENINGYIKSIKITNISKNKPNYILVLYKNVVVKELVINNFTLKNDEIYNIKFKTCRLTFNDKTSSYFCNSDCFSGLPLFNYKNSLCLINISKIRIVNYKLFLHELSCSLKDPVENIINPIDPASFLINTLFFPIKYLNIPFKPRIVNAKH